jgi:hypothetical protein
MPKQKGTERTSGPPYTNRDATEMIQSDMTFHFLAIKVLYFPNRPGNGLTIAGLIASFSVPIVVRHK